MGLLDVFLMVIVIAGTIYLLYRSLWKKRNQCCDGCGNCESGKSGECEELLHHR